MHNRLGSGDFRFIKVFNLCCSSSQFYINVADNFSLDPMPTRWGYAVFGDVIDGFQIIDAIASNATQTMGGMQDVPAAPVIILDVKRID